MVGSLFVPAESLFSAALEGDHDLIIWAADKRILLATPASLIALLRSVSVSWQQHAQTENAAAIAEIFYGCGRQRDDFLYLFLGPAIGGGIAIDGDCVRGLTGNKTPESSPNTNGEAGEPAKPEQPAPRGRRSAAAAAPSES